MARKTIKHGDTWFIDDPDYDYSAEIKKAADEGDYQKAAYLEKSRNAKIDRFVMPYDKTYAYQDFLKPSDGDTAKASVPAFEKGSYTDKADKSLKKANAMNFHYNANTDPLYKQIKKNYQNTAADVIENTLGVYAGMTGGVPSSYAASAAAQVGASHLQKADDMIPELYQLAYSKYADDKADLYKQYSIYQGLDDQQYNRNYQEKRDKISDERYDTQWQNTLDRQDVEDERYKTQWDYNIAEDAEDDLYRDTVYTDSRADKDWEKEKYNEEMRKEGIFDSLGLGVPPNDEDAMALFGLSGQELLNAYKNFLAWQQDPTAVSVTAAANNMTAGTPFEQYMALQGNGNTGGTTIVAAGAPVSAYLPQKAAGDTASSPLSENEQNAQSKKAPVYQPSPKTDEELYTQVTEEEFNNLLPYYDNPASGGTGLFIIDFTPFTKEQLEEAIANGTVKVGNDGLYHINNK